MRWCEVKKDWCYKLAYEKFCEEVGEVCPYYVEVYE